MKITDKEAILSLYGDGFADIIGKKNVEFTEDGINVTLFGKDVYYSSITDKTSSVVPMREPRTRDLRLMDRFKGDIEKTIALLSAITGIDEDDINDMTAKNLKLLTEVSACFLSDSQATGNV